MVSVIASSVLVRGGLFHLTFDSTGTSLILYLIGHLFVRLSIQGFLFVLHVLHSFLSAVHAKGDFIICEKSRILGTWMAVSESISGKEIRSMKVRETSKK